MAELTEVTEADLMAVPCVYNSPRALNDVLLGEDAARPVIQASSGGNDSALQSLLLQPHYTKIMLERPHCIYSEDSPYQSPTHIRQVSARPMSNIERAMTVASANGHVTAVSTLLKFAKDQRTDLDNIINRPIVVKTIRDGHADVFKLLASAHPDIVNMSLGHGTLPLYEALTWQQTDIVAHLLELGADPLHPVKPTKLLGTHDSSIMSHAAISQDSRLLEMLLERGVSVSNTGALHSAAMYGRLDNMRLLMKNGADVNETLAEWSNWTPMHFAAIRGKVDAMKLLEQNGGRANPKDEDSKTPDQLLEQYNAHAR